MRFITEIELRDRFAGGFPDAFDLPPNARLTPAARQYLSEHGLYREGDAPSGAPRRASAEQAPAVPQTEAAYQKPEHMTHLTRTLMTCKANPRIELRGKLDSLEAEILLALCEAPASFALPLEDALSLVRHALASDVKEEQLGEWRLDGMTAEQVHRASHHPEELGFAGHILPSASQGRFAALLNRLRAQTRECELCAVRAFWRSERLERRDLVLALNRLSSYFYVLQLRAIAEHEGRK